MFCIYCMSVVSTYHYGVSEFSQCDNCMTYIARQSLSLMYLNVCEAGMYYDDVIESTQAHDDMPEPFIATDGIWLSQDNDIPTEWPSDIPPWDMAM